MNEPVDFEWLKTESEFANILRWEDDGGKSFQSILPKIDQPVTIEVTRSRTNPSTLIIVDSD